MSEDNKKCTTTASTPKTFVPLPEKIRTRFAPSPTGYLHIGGLRTALYAYLYAKHTGGEFFINTLEWAGMTIDAGPKNPDDLGPYTQSERLPLYKKYAQQLIDEGHAYRCFCTKERIDKIREEQMASKQAPMYDRHCRYLSEDEIQEKLDAKMPFVVRQAIPLNERVKFKDIVRKKVNFDTNTLDDQVLLKSDGFPTYHLAVVVDDHLMKITHVIRGEEWLPSTPKHILLYKAFGWEPTHYAHLSLILNKDRSKLSKRQNDVSTESYIQKGYTKEALINFIALLGWNSSDNQEMFSLDELIETFELERVQKSGAIFDLDKLDWFNWQWKRRQHLEKLQEIAKDLDPDVEITTPKKGHLNFKFANTLSQEQFTQKRAALLLELCQEFLSPDILKHKDDNLEFFSKVLVSTEEKILKDPQSTMDNIQFFFKDNYTYDLNLFINEKMKIDQSIALQAIQTSVENLTPEDFKDEETLKNKFISLIQNLGLKNGQVLWPVRVALSNEQFSPGVWDLALAYGYKDTLEKLKAALDFLQ